MSKFSLKMACVAALVLLMASPGYTHESIDLTQHFARETMALAETEFKDINGEAVRRVPAGVAYADIKPPEVGDMAVFNTYNIKRNAPEKINAQLKKIGKHCYVYLQQNSRRIDAAGIGKIATTFDNRIYPECRSMFGNEWNPGIDGDSRITLLLLDIQDTYNPEQGQKGFTAGYFNAGDCYAKSKYPNSNEREMLYLDIYPSDPSTDKFLSVIAHEFQHMIHWNNDPKEFTWVNESLSQLAPFLCGYGHPPQVQAFVRNPDNNMAAWSNDDMIANYGQVYLWSQYISTRIASTDDRRRAFVRRMVAQTSQGFSGLNAAIKKQGIKNNARNLFRNFCVANYLNDDRIEQGTYSYEKSLARLALTPEIKISSAPFEGKGSVKCWSAKAVQINPVSFKGRQFRVSFAGQKISATNYSNDFDVALVRYSSDGKKEPLVDWLDVTEFKASKVFSHTTAHDRMMLIIINRGPETMKIEQAFAKGAAPAAFSFAVRTISAQNGAPRIARSGSSSSSARRTSRSRARSIMEEISNAGFDESAGLLLSADADVDRSAAEIDYDFAFQKITMREDELISSIREGVGTGDYSLVEEFTTFFAAGNDEGKAKLQTLKNRIRDILKFEQLQENETAAGFLTVIEP